MRKVLVKVIAAVLFVIWIPFLVAGSILYILSSYLRAFALFLRLDTAGGKREAYAANRSIRKFLNKSI